MNKRPAFPAKPYRPPAPADGLEGLRRKVFAVGREAGLLPMMVKDRTLLKYGVPVFDKLNVDQLGEVLADLQKEAAERKRSKQRVEAILQDTSRRAVEPIQRSGLRRLASATDGVSIEKPVEKSVEKPPVVNESMHPLVRAVLTRFPDAKVVTLYENERKALKAA